jgi:PAS domain S-box-containing protein
MNEKKNGNDRRTSLRKTAESMVVNLSPSEATAQPTEVLMHELLVHKVELEIQNEELRKSHIEMEESRDRYVDHYEFSPINYMTISRVGLITEINLTGCSQFGIERRQLINQRLSHYVSHDERDRWHRLFMTMMEHTDTKKQAFTLEMIRSDGSLFYAFLNCQKWNTTDTLSVLKIALTDISALKINPQQQFAINPLDESV